MEEIVRRYFINEKHLSLAESQKCYQHLQKHPEIFKEFLYWVYTGCYISKVNVEGYSAKDIFRLAHHLDGIGVFNFLITLKERPIVGFKIINNGFIRK